MVSIPLVSPSHNSNTYGPNPFVRPFPSPLIPPPFSLPLSLLPGWAALLDARSPGPRNQATGPYGHPEGCVYGARKAGRRKGEPPGRAHPEGRRGPGKGGEKGAPFLSPPRGQKKHEKSKMRHAKHNTKITLKYTSNKSFQIIRGTLAASGGTPALKEKKTRI